MTLPNQSATKEPPNVSLFSFEGVTPWDVETLRHLKRLRDA